MLIQKFHFLNGWKANLHGVDLNLQFPAGWDKAKETKFKKGFYQPAPRDFVGNYYLSEPESIAVYNFTKSHSFDRIYAFHSQGNVIYWKYQDFLPSLSYEIGKKLSEVSGYSLDLTPPESSYAGFKDWFIQTYNKPGYTIEVGLRRKPTPSLSIR